MYNFRKELQHADFTTKEKNEQRDFSEQIIVAYLIQSECKDKTLEKLFNLQEDTSNTVLTFEAYGYKREMSFFIKKSGKYIISESEKGENRTLKIKTNFNTKTRELKLLVDVNFQGKYLVSKILTTLNIQKAIIIGDIKINGYLLTDGNERLTIDFDTDSLNARIKWWEKVQEIEQRLSCQFKLELPLSRTNYELLQKLHIGLVENKTYKEYISIKNFTTELINKDDIKEIPQKPNAKVSLQTVKSMDLRSLGTPKKIFVSAELMDLPVVKSKLDENNKEIQVDFKNNHFNTVLETGKIFLDKKQAEQYQSTGKIVKAVDTKRI